MAEPKITGFIPEWFRDQPLDAADEIPVAFGTIPDKDPRVVACRHLRLLPAIGGIKCEDCGYLVSDGTFSDALNRVMADQAKAPFPGRPTARPRPTSPG